MSKTIYQKLAEIQVSFKSKKSRFNNFGKYNFRSAEDILEGLKPEIAKHNVIFLIKEELIEPGVLKSTAMIQCAEGGNFIEATAIVGVDLNQKGMQVPQQYGSASSYGKKYALGNLLLIDDTADADATNTHGRGQAATKPEINDSNLEKAKAFLQNGGSLDQLKKQYTISNEVLAKLQK